MRQVRIAAALVIASVFVACGEPVAPTAPEVDPNSEAARVIVLANASDPESVELARFYAERRAIPAANIVVLPLPTEETISWDQFVGEVFNPFLSWLIEHDWIDATESELRDGVGRMRIAPMGHRISYLVTCRGVPLRIAHDPTRVDEVANRRLQKVFRTNQAAVDSELALLAISRSTIDGLVANPLYASGGIPSFEQDLVVRVSRLDGPGLAACQRLVESALAGERNGLVGRAYIDLCGRHPDGDRWLRAAGDQLQGLGFEVDVHEAAPVMAATDRFDEPVFYFGWYSARPSGPFLREGFRFVPGAVALHIFSFSATTLRSPTQGWSGPFVEYGVAATVGNVFEPYLQFTHRPDLIVERLAAGDAWGAAAWYALPAISWQAIAIGDPLYRPFANTGMDAENGKLAGR